jgi:hypothetical protein
VNTNKGEVPADGELQLGHVRLPAGRRVYSHTALPAYGLGSDPADWTAEQAAQAREWELAHPSVPLLWTTLEPVPDAGRVWHELRQLAPQTGRVPITLGFLDRRQPRGRPWESGELGDPFPLSAADEVDATALLRGHWGCRRSRTTFRARRSGGCGGTNSNDS